MRNHCWGDTLVHFQDREAMSDQSTLATQICNQISAVFSATSTAHPPALQLLVTELSEAAHIKASIFFHGVGRELLMLKSLCMRLAHLGLPAHLVGHVTTPPISSRDLLIASAGPGGFSTVDAICRVAQSNGARVVVLTAQPEGGTTAKYASTVVYVPEKTMADDGESSGGGRRELLPMGSLYEGALFVLFEMVVFKLGEILGESPQNIRCRHTNLE